jgi:CheY-like chemotaxis protein
LVLLDICLPQMDGPDILGMIRPERGGLPAAAQAMNREREKTAALGFNDWVNKPILDEAALLGTIKQWMGSEEKANEDPRGR